MLHENCRVHKQFYQKAEDSRAHLNAGHNMSCKLSKGSHTHTLGAKEGARGKRSFLLPSRFSFDLKVQQNMQNEQDPSTMQYDHSSIVSLFL